MPDFTFEDDTVTLRVAFTDPDADMHAITIAWGDNQSSSFTLMGNERSFSATHRYFDDVPSGTAVDLVRVSVGIDDLANPVVRATSNELTVNNVAPVVTAFRVTPATIPDGQTATAIGSWIDPSRGETYTVELDWGDGSPKTLRTFAGQFRDFSLPHVYLRGGNYTLTAKVTDDDTGFGTRTTTIAVTSLNNPPSDLVATIDPAVEGGSAPLIASFVDLDAGDTHTATIDWGDGAAPQSLALAAGVTRFSPAHVYRDSGAYTATVKVADGSASTPLVSVPVTVANVGPTVTLNLSATSIREQESVTADVTFADPGLTDTFNVTVAWGDGSTWSVDLAAGAGSASASHQYVAAGRFDVIATVTDSDNGAASATKPLEVRALNRAPTGFALSADSPADGNPATLTGSFTDLDASDTHTVAVAWGDGSVGTLALGAGAASFSTTHTYATRGTYHVTATVTDPAGLAASAGTDVVVQKKNADKKDCDKLMALEQRLFHHAWSNAARGIFARLTAMINARYGCDDDEGAGGASSPQAKAKDRSGRSDR